MATKKTLHGAIPWTPETWDKGYIKISRGEKRFWVFRPDHPQSNKQGWVLRSRVVWWLAHDKKLPPKGWIIHHDNENTLDDVASNLIAMSVPDHVKLHHQKADPAYVTCLNCQDIFIVPYHISAQRMRDGRKNGPSYCSQECYWESRRGKRGYPKNGMSLDRADELRAMAAKGEPVTSLTKLFGLSKSMVYGIIKGQKWKSR